MAVYKEGYECPVCGPIRAKLWWSNEENDLMASCSKCGIKIQRVIPQTPSWVKRNERKDKGVQE